MCSGHNGYYAASDDLARLTAVADPILREVRACLDANAGKHVPSVLVIRWNSEGEPVDVKIDVPGYQGLPCVQSAQAKIATLQNPRETSIRCELGCPKPPPPTPAPAPVVVPAPAPTTQPIPTNAPGTQPATAAPPAPTPAAAPPPVPEQPRYEKVWYGYQTLIADAITLGLLVGGTASRSGGAVTTGYVGFLLGTPIVHMVHGNLGPGFASIGIRLMLPLIGMGVGAVVGVISGGTQGSGDLERFGNGANGAINGLVIGGFIGAAGCVAIDALGFAYTKERTDERANNMLRPKLRQQPWFRLAPAVDVQKDRASLGITGRF
jgi:hypothetical protein